MRPSLVISLTALALASATAWADKPTVEEAKAAVIELRNTLRDADPPDLEAGLALLVPPLWFDGFRYWSVDKRAAHACERRFTTSGRISTAKGLVSFVRCAAMASWKDSIDGPGEFHLVEGKIPSVFRKYRTRLAQLAKDHVLVFSHFCPAAPGDYWTLYAVTRSPDGHARIDALLARGDDGDCREE